jgi:hypothetical protein
VCHKLHALVRTPTFIPSHIIVLTHSGSRSLGE